MNDKNMTALVSCFARSYHYKNNKYRIFSDNIAGRVLGDKDYNSIASNMSKGINFFNSNFDGRKDEALRWIVDNRLSPSLLGRSAFCEDSLSRAIRFGCRQYLIFASGYDTFAYRNNIRNLKIFEIDKSEMIEDKIRRLDKGNLDYSKVNFIKCDFTDKLWVNKIMDSVYDKEKISFSSLLGISYYLTKEEFSNMIKYISNIICDGSSIVFDYPTYVRGEEARINEELAKGAKEEMKAKYSYHEMEKLLQEHNILIYEHLNDQEMTDIYFKDYNLSNPNDMIIAPRGVSYLLGVKKK